jgi:hypothetical protein
MPIYEGDILRTDTGAETAVYFTDSSILRLYMDTTVSLAQGSNNAGDPIAQVILQSGALW